MIEDKIKKIIENALELDRSLSSFQKIFEKEELAVAAHDINSLEQAYSDKEIQSSALESQVNSLLDSANQLKNMLGSEYDKNDRLKTLTDVLDCLKIVFLSYEPASNDQKLVNEASKMITNIVEKFSSLKPALERNRYIIARLLEHHQQSYRFWSEVHRESSENYDSTGCKKSRKTLSQVFAKA